MSENKLQSNANEAETGFAKAIELSDTGSSSTVSAGAVNDGSDEEITKEIETKQTKQIFQATDDLQATTAGVYLKARLFIPYS